MADVEVRITAAGRSSKDMPNCGSSFRGNWSKSTSYKVSESVQYSDLSFVSRVDSNLGKTPGDPSTTKGPKSTCGDLCPWSLLASAPAGKCEEIAAPKEGTTAPGVIALLPREKTYNVTSIKDSRVSLGAGAVVANVINLGINWMGRKQAYYIVQAVDTVALQRATTQAATTVLAWQFRPVLGEKSVKPGLRQVFARLSFDVSGVAEDLAQVTVRTTWRRYDQKTGVVGGSTKIDAWSHCYPLIDTAGFAIGSSLEWSDLGNGQIAVTDNGVFPPGTSILLPEGPITDTSPNFLLDSKRLMFNLAAAQVVRSSVGSVVSIAGNPCELQTTAYCVSGASAKIEVANVEPYNATQSKVIVNLKDGDITNYEKAPPLVLLGSHVYGLRDAPFYEVQWAKVEGNAALRKWKRLSVIAATDDVRQARGVSLAHPFCGSAFYDSAQLVFGGVLPRRSTGPGWLISV